MSFHNLGLTQILIMRKQNRTILDLFKYYQSIETPASDYISAIHVLRLCHENNLPYTPAEIRRFCKRVYGEDMGGDRKTDNFKDIRSKSLKEDNVMTLRQFTKDCGKYSGKHKIRFKLNHIPSKKPADSLIKLKKLSPVATDNEKVVSMEVLA